MKTVLYLSALLMFLFCFSLHARDLFSDDASWQRGGNSAWRKNGEIEFKPGPKMSRLMLKKDLLTTNFVFSCEVIFSAFHGDTELGVDFRKVGDYGEKLIFNYGGISLLSRRNNLFAVAAQKTLSPIPYEWYRLQIQANEREIIVSLGGNEIFRALINGVIKEGSFAVVGIGPLLLRNYSLRVIADPGNTEEKTITPVKSATPQVCLFNGIFFHVYGCSGEDIAKLNSSVISEHFHRHTNSADTLTKKPNADELLPKANVVVLANVNAQALENGEFDISKLAQFVKAGGGLVILGGQFAFGAGNYQNTPLAEMCPVDSKKIFDRMRSATDLRFNIELPNHPLLKNITLDDKPALRYYHAIIPKPGAEIAMTAGGNPILVAQKYGQGRVVAFCGTAWGEPAKPFWNSKEWMTLLKNMLYWTAQCEG